MPFGVSPLTPTIDTALPASIQRYIVRPWRAIQRAAKRSFAAGSGVCPRASCAKAPSHRARSSRSPSSAMRMSSSPGRGGMTRSIRKMRSDMLSQCFRPVSAVHASANPRLASVPPTTPGTSGTARTISRASIGSAAGSIGFERTTRKPAMSAAPTISSPARTTAKYGAVAVRVAVPRSSCDVNPIIRQFSASRLSRDPPATASNSAGSPGRSRRRSTASVSGTSIVPIPTRATRALRTSRVPWSDASSSWHLELNAAAATSHGRDRSC